MVPSECVVYSVPYLAWEVEKVDHALRYKDTMVPQLRLFSKLSGGHVLNSGLLSRGAYLGLQDDRSKKELRLWKVWLGEV